MLTLIRTILLAAALAVPAQADTRLELEAELTWASAGEWFGGFSGIEVLNQGRKMYLITDKSHLSEVAMERTNGVLTDLQVTQLIPLRYSNGQEAKGTYTDAEGLVVTPNGRMFITFEKRHRLAEVDPVTGQFSNLPNHPDFEEFQENSGLEALARHPDGRLFAFPERSGHRLAPFKLYVFDGSRWQITGQLARRGPFLPVGADFDDNGRLYLLERAIGPLGFRSRIRRFDPEKSAEGDITLLTTAPARFDNLEGISVWQDENGQTKLTLISDDNFLSIQRTQIIEFLVKE